MRTVYPAPHPAPHPALPPPSERAGHSWAPLSPCTEGCLPAPDSLPRVSDVRVAARLAGLVAVLAGAGLVTLVLPLFGRQRIPVLRALFRSLLFTVGVRVVVRGPKRLRAGDAGGVLVVSNHLSWLDVLALGAVHPMRMVAKCEIRDYPVLGAFAKRIGTLFIDRSELRPLPGVVAKATEVLRAGGMVGLFPEGTTWCGAASGVFRPAGFQAALDAGVPIRPVAQRLWLPDGSPTSVGAFVGDDTVLDSLLRVARLPGLVVEAQVLPVLEAGPGSDRRALARDAELAIAAATGVPAPADRRPARAVPLAA
ncbi:MAG: 1-acyl-sn-glycerol-3-phosphate acyltransferase [Actinomycetota bacterium]|nr:1-acyl-sn-glycerol-3-phosphate acyltransferase [Actinomycetota bacterium]